MPELATDSELLHYRIVSKLGVGGMGEVYLAEDTRLHRKVALKFLAEEFRAVAEHVNRFGREARSASALNHPNICTIYEINENGDVPFIAMEYIEGETLAAMISRRRRSVRQTIDIACQVVDALAEAHASGIIHRDIKPANIIVSLRGQAKILDFGLAKKVETLDAGNQFATQAGMILGTASYMSPEQARGFEVDARTDIWSFGVCLYEMLTGKQPFTGETSSDTLASILTRDPARPSHYLAGIPNEFERIILKALHRKKEKRYQTAAELLEDLRKLKKRIDIHDDSDTADDFSNEQTEAFDNAPTEVVHSAEANAGKSSPNNLSSPRTPIIGREEEIESLAALLYIPETRLITLTGIGGTGKTRLALAVAEKMLDSFEDGVFFVEMASVRQFDLVPSTIAQAIGVKDEGSKPVLDVLKSDLREKKMLLVIDNFEQVVDAATLLAELCAATNELKILVTSRTILNLTAEKEFVVQPLTAPGEDAAISLMELRNNEAVRLFEERARAAKRSFAVTDENAPAVAAICSRLDGLPLAIELAAARSRILSPAAILSNLDNRLKFLSGGPRDLPERQRTMQGAVEWSYELLSEDEKSMFRRLGVFEGGFRLDAVWSSNFSLPHDSQEDPPKSGTPNSPNVEVLDLVISLVDQSLLIQKERPDGEARFRMLEVVRDFALEKLESNGELDDTRRAHAQCYLKLAEEAEPFIQASQSAEWFKRLEEDNDNLRAAMHWSLENELPMAVRLAAALRNFWILYGHLTEGYGLLKAASMRGGEPPAELRFKLMNGVGLAARFRGDFDTAHEAYTKGLAAGLEVGDKRGIALSSRGLGLVSMQRGDRAGAREYFSSALAISRELEDKFGTALSLAFLGDLARTEGEFGKARPLFEESLELFRELDNKSAAGDAQNNLAAACFGEGDFASAKKHFAEAANIALDLGNKITISCAFDGFAALAVERGDYKRAAKLSGAADNLRESVGYKIEPAEEAFRKAYVDKLRAAMPEDDLSSNVKVGSALPIDEAVGLMSEPVTTTGDANHQTIELNKME